jgi:hypothetical protein
MKYLTMQKERKLKCTFFSEDEYNANPLRERERGSTTTERTSDLLDLVITCQFGSIDDCITSNVWSKPSPQFSETFLKKARKFKLSAWKLKMHGTLNPKLI